MQRQMVVGGLGWHGEQKGGKFVGCDSPPLSKIRVSGLPVAVMMGLECSAASGETFLSAWAVDWDMVRAAGAVRAAFASKGESEALFNAIVLRDVDFVLREGWANDG